METIKQKITNYAGEKLACEMNIPENLGINKPVFLILHAFNGKKENRTIYYLAKELCNLGCKTVQFDFSGHGESEGKLEECNITKQLKEIADVVEKLKLDLENLILIGNSFSVITTLAFANRNSSIKGVVLLCGRARYLEYIKNLEKVGDKYRLFGDNFIDESFVEDYTQYDPLKNIKNLDLPTLIIHGEKDETVPVENAKLFYESSPSSKKTLKIIPEADHRFSDIKFKEKIIKKIMSFVGLNLK